MAPIEGRVARPEQRWGCHRGTPLTTVYRGSWEKGMGPCFSDILVTGQLTATPTHGLDSGHFTGKPTCQLDNSVTMQF